ncbi:haloacid dehalogenase [Candidatus Francisella endociliophora]|uniref:Haloacid dehalogenase n=1 Tax=Candidatus Francisella endociliophora TaxID=653937 RepID=A0A097EN30_9GAMM|nr:pyrimidine 5'-nucleotidase [Francisella sp. FSC1006]AIT08973.1 haloacid dehalogenase [Francisella sp. FSC1006]
MKTYIFDLDNTLYSYKNGLFDSQLKRMSEYVRLKLDISDTEKADSIRDELYYEFGSTMLGMMRYHNIDYKEFLNYIDDIEIDHFKPNEKLNSIINELRRNHRTYIFTNASNFHTYRVLHQLGLADSFDGVLTLEDTGLVAKPKYKYFEIGRYRFNIDLNNAIFFEDSSHNLITAKHLGMETVLIHADDSKSAANFHDNVEIDYYVADVESFFEGRYIATRV